MTYDAQHPLDEYTLAAFLNGTLSEEQHRDVLVYLADSGEAREVVCMAQDAMEAAREPVTEPFALPAASPKLAPRPARDPSRPALALVHWQRYAVAATVLVLMVMGLYAALPGTTDTLRGGDDTNTLAVQLDAVTLEMSWTALPDAYSYRMVVWDVEAAESIARQEVRTTHLGETDAIVQDLRTHLERGRAYEIRIDALDAENRVIRQADLLPFTYQP